MLKTCWMFFFWFSKVPNFAKGLGVEEFKEQLGVIVRSFQSLEFVAGLGLCSLIEGSVSRTERQLVPPLAGMVAWLLRSVWATGLILHVRLLQCLGGW